MAAPDPSSRGGASAPDEREQAFLRHIRTALQKPPAERFARPSAGRPTVGDPPASLGPAELISRFEAELLSLGGSQFWRAPTAAEAARPLLALLAEQAAGPAAGAPTLLAPHDPRLFPLIAALHGKGVGTMTWGRWDEGGDDTGWRARAAGARLGLVWADAAIAETGTLVVASHPAHGRSVSLLPPVLVGLFSATEIVLTRAEAFRRLRAAGALERGAGISLITGPSRTADIEGDLAIGVHGPGLVVAVAVAAPGESLEKREAGIS